MVPCATPPLSAPVSGGRLGRNRLMMTGPAVPTGTEDPRWMCDAVTFVMLVSVSVQLMTFPLSTNVKTPLPGGVCPAPSAAALRLATYVFAVGAVLLVPQLTAKAAITTAPTN